MLIGVISDTHLPDRWRELPDVIFDLFADVDLILHAGDVGELRVLDDLGRCAPVIAVHGNDETDEATAALPYLQTLMINGRRIVLTHAHYPDRAEELASRTEDMQPLLQRRADFAKQHGAEIIVFGHSHIPMWLQHDDVWLLNPGAIAGGNELLRQSLQSVAMLHIPHDDSPVAVKHIDLKHPDTSFVPDYDLSAGFTAVHNHFSESILAPDLEAIIQQLRPVYLSDPALHAIWMQLAHRCWSGEKEVISLRDLAQAVHEAEARTTLPAFTEDSRARLLTIEPFAAIYTQLMHD